MPTSTETKAKRPRINVRYARDDEMTKVWELDRLNLKENWDYFPATSEPLEGQALIQHHRRVVSRWYVPTRHKIIVALIDDEIVGHAWYAVERDLLFMVRIGFLFSIVVAPAHRRKGVARRLLREFKRRSKMAGAKYVRLAVMHQNNGACNMYRQEGFFDDTHYMLARLEPSAPDKRKQEAAERKRNSGKTAKGT